MRHELHHRWLKTKRHLHSLRTSRRALRDAARAATAAAARLASSRERLCRPSAGLAA
jgi:hypothetical protein